MVDPSSPPLQAPAPAPQKTNPWIYIVAAVILVCCLCFGAVGLLLAFGPEILHEFGLSSLLPNLSMMV